MLKLLEKAALDEDVVLGACPRINILIKLKHFLKTISTTIYLILRALFFDNSEKFGQKGILGQPPSR